MNERLGMGRMRIEELNRIVPFLTGAEKVVMGSTSHKVCEEAGVILAWTAGFDEEAMVVAAAVVGRERVLMEDTALSRAPDCMMAKVSTAGGLVCEMVRV